ncbi:MAG: hypothetical protein PVI23_05795 [Maricaulaceae bacterium]|jgi:hypothetical protein
MADANTDREAVAAFNDAAALQAAIDDLLTHGFDRAELSLLASEQAVVDKLGHEFRSTRELEDAPDVPTVAYVARESVGEAEGHAIGALMYVGAMIGMVPVIASGGAIGAAIAAGAVLGGAGAAIGVRLADLIGHAYADRINEQLENGGLLLWVRTRDEAHERKAVEILKRRAGEDVHVHGLPNRQQELGAVLAGGDAPEIGLRRDVYHGFQILKAADGHCYALGRLFPDDLEAKRYIHFVEQEE